MQHAVGIFDVLLCGGAVWNVLSQRLRVPLGKGAKPRNQRRKRHDEEGPESLHSGTPGFRPPRLWDAAARSLSDYYMPLVCPFR